MGSEYRVTMSDVDMNACHIENEDTGYSRNMKTYKVYYRHDLSWQPLSTSTRAFRSTSGTGAAEETRKAVKGMNLEAAPPKNK